jgi:hypothetical protein
MVSDDVSPLTRSAPRADEIGASCLNQMPIAPRWTRASTKSQPFGSDIRQIEPVRFHGRSLQEHQVQRHIFARDDLQRS